MSKKAKQLFGSLKRKDLDIVAAVLEEKQIMSESDPFAFVRLALDLLVAGNLTREALKDSLESNLEWAEGTANSHVGIVFNLFNYIGEAGEAA